jgi:hypothetical protein
VTLPVAYLQHGTARVLNALSGLVDAGAYRVLLTVSGVDQCGEGRVLVDVSATCLGFSRVKNQLAILSVEKNEQQQWVFTWSDSGAASYRLVLNGNLIDTTEDLEYTFALPGYDSYPPPLEVVDDGDLAMSEKNRPFLVMQWYRSEGATYYEVQENVSGTWTRRAVITDLGALQWVYTMRTPTLDDQTDYSFRVVAIGTVGDSDGDLNFNATIVRPPTLAEDSIEVGYDDSTGSVTITEA